MGAAKEYGLRHVEEFKTLMTGVDRVKGLVTYAEQNPEQVARIYYGYYSIIKHMVNLDEKELEIIDAVNQNSEKGNPIRKFQEIIAGRQEDFMSLVAKACNPETKTYELGIKRLTKMMKKADKIRNENPEARPHDSTKDNVYDPIKWDNVIWGYTLGAVDPKTDIHLCINHGLTQIINRSFFKKLKDLQGPEKKDWFINAITEVVALEGAQGKGWGAEFYQQWRAPRPNGLGWISEKRESAYKTQLQTHVTATKI